MMTTKKKRILIIEDETHIAEGLKLNLLLQGYEVDLAGDGLSGLRGYKANQPDLIVLDIMLPGMDGLSVLKKIREEDERIPILILSAKNASDDKVQGLAFGVDDYVTKPFNLEEFILRVERLILRAAWSQEERELSREKYVFGENEIFFNTLTAMCGGNEIHLTELELRLLKLFIANRGEVLSRSEILENVWGYARNTSTRTVDNFIVRFRKYFETNPKEPVYFKSLRSVGYVFDHD
ncbi:MAG: response regulator transcription factor [Desulfobacterales bacterium]|jgi:DNA-binding response OmpR family regulator|nr:response regulator transcription factor [Desulfobacterales bacterium]